MLRLGRLSLKWVSLFLACYSCAVLVDDGCVIPTMPPPTPSVAFLQILLCFASCLMAEAACYMLG
jgi:hypothetical protein